MLLRGARMGCLLVIGAALGVWITTYLWMRQVRVRTVTIGTTTHSRILFRDEVPHEWVLVRLFRPFLRLDERLTGLVVDHLPEPPRPAPY